MVAHKLVNRSNKCMKQTTKQKILKHVKMVHVKTALTYNTRTSVVLLITCLLITTNQGYFIEHF